jgi:NAD(P)-dependent dehydrogenase (short-subunit alcohol dehydrogenase family)
MSGLLANHIAAVTGAGSGIGRAIAQGYAREGAQVAVLDLNGEAASETAQQILNAGSRAMAFTLDVTDRDACRVMATKVAGEVGNISILVNNAGINRRNAFTGEASAVIKDWEDIIAINLNGTFNVTHAFIEQLRATRGRIVNIGSIQSPNFLICADAGEAASRTASTPMKGRMAGLRLPDNRRPPSRSSR